MAGERTLNPPAPNVGQTLCKITVDYASPSGGELVDGRKLRHNVDHAAGNAELNPVSVFDAWRRTLGGTTKPVLLLTTMVMVTAYLIGDRWSE